MNPLTYPLVEFFADVVRGAEGGIPRLEPVAHGALPDFSSLTRPPRERSIASVFLGGDALKADIRRFLHLRRGRLPDDPRWSVEPIWEVERKLSQVEGYRPGTFIGYLRISCDLREQVEEHRTWIEGRMIGQLRRRLASASGLLLSRSIAQGNSVLEEMLERDDREEVRGFCDLIRVLGLRVGLPLLAQPRTLDRALLEFALAVLSRTTSWNRSHAQASRPVRPLDIFFGAQAMIAFHQGQESCSLVEIRDRVLVPGAPLSSALDSWLRGLQIHVGDSLLPCRVPGAIAADDDPRSWIWTAVQDLVTSTDGETPNSGRLAFLERSLREYAARFEAFKHAIADRVQSLAAGQLVVAARSSSSGGASRAEPTPRFETAIPFGPIEGLDPTSAPLPLRPLPASTQRRKPQSAPSAPAPLAPQVLVTSVPVAGPPAAPPPPSVPSVSSTTLSAPSSAIIFGAVERPTASASTGVPLSPLVADIPLSPLLADPIPRTPASDQQAPDRADAPETDPDHSGEWPALYSLSDLERQATYLEEAMRSGWTSHGRRWVEMLHRYLGDARFREFLGFEDAWAAGVRDNLIGGPALLYAGLEDLIRFVYRGTRHLVDLDFRYNQRQGDVPQKRTGYDWIALRLCYLAFHEVLVRQDDPEFAPSALVVFQHWHSFSRLRGQSTHTPEWWAWLADEVEARREAVATQKPAPRGFRMVPAVEESMRRHVAVPAPQIATLGKWAQTPLHALRLEPAPELRRWASRLSMLSQLVEVAKEDALAELG